MESFHSLEKTGEHLDAMIRREKTAHLEFRSGIGVQSTVVVQDIDELKFVSNSNSVIVRIVSRCDLDSSSSKLHIDGFLIANDRDPSSEERM